MSEPTENSNIPVSSVDSSISAAPANSAAGALAKIEPVDKINIPDYRDRRSHLGMRETITVWLVGLLCAIVALAFIALFLDQDAIMLDKRYERLKTLLDVIMGPVITLLSSVIGFYFGSQVGQQRNSSSDR